MRIFSFRNFRVLILLLVLAAVALYSKDQRLVTQGWYQPLEIVIHPINPDGSAKIDQYIAQLSNRSFRNIDQFLQKQSNRYDIITSTPTKTRLGTTLSVHPPEAPHPSSNKLSIMWWSLKLRWWLWRNAPNEPQNDTGNDYLVRMFVYYHDPAKVTHLRHSLGLQKGLVGIVHAFGSKQYTQQNNIVIAHEFLHTVGATDKYDAQGLPIPPHGLGNPEQQPLYPQKRAEIMAGKRAISAFEAEMPRSLRKVIIGKQTASEIGWIENEQ